VADQFLRGTTFLQGHRSLRDHAPENRANRMTTGSL